MPKFDRIDGQYVATQCTWGERKVFSNAKWQYNRHLKRWVTQNEDAALALREHATGLAKEHLDNVVALRKAAVAASWAEDTDTEFPAPEGLAYMPFQKAGVEYIIDGDDTLVADPPGLGKAQPIDEPVLTPSGWRLMGELKVGDSVIGSQGTPVSVTGVFPQGEMPLYRVTFKDGATSYCNDEHLWTVYSNSFTGKNPQTLTLRNLVERGLRVPSGRRKFRVPLVKPVQFCTKEYTIDPYLMGLLIGDGGISSSNVTLGLHHDDALEIVPVIENLVHLPYAVKTTAHPLKKFTYVSISKESGGNSPSVYVDEIRRLRLRVVGKDKFIPEEYLLGDVQQRTRLLWGLMDSDGSASCNRSRYSTTSHKLAHDVQRLVWSLGGSASVTTHRGGSEYTVSINTHFNPFSLPRKHRLWKARGANHGPSRFIDTVEYVKDCEQVCISVDAPDRLYVTRDYTVTHNTIQAIGAHNVEGFKRVLVVCPASLKVNWSREWRKWDIHGRSVGIAMSTLERYTVEEFDENTEEMVKVRKTRTRHDWPDTDVVIINYDMLISFDEHIKGIDWDYLICDEAHLLKTKTSIRTMCIFGGKKKARKKDGKVVEKAKTLKKISACRRVFLTGTPILSKPSELWTLIRACDPKGLGKDWEKFAYRYCDAEAGTFGLDSSGASNLDELGRILRERFMIRRKKEAVLKELPPKTREVIVLPQDKLERKIKKERDRVEEAMDSFEAMMGIDSTAGDFRYLSAIEEISGALAAALEVQDSEEPNWSQAVKALSPPQQLLFTELSEAREEVALGKIKLVVEHVKGLIECGEPVILFAHHKSVISELEEALTKAGITVGTITGNVAANARQPVVDKFQEGEIDVILGNIFAMGVGLTMTRGRFVVFAELDWTPALIEQAEDRAWRHGQLNAVVVQYLIVDGSIEAQLAQMILQKMGVIFEALDAENS